MRSLSQRLFFIVLLACPAAWAAHGYALWGDLKYPPGFANFDYVNAQAPKEAFGKNEKANRSRRRQKTSLSCNPAPIDARGLTFQARSVCSAQPLGSLGRQMRNIITKLLIVVVPRRTAGGG